MSRPAGRGPSIVSLALPTIVSNLIFSMVSFTSIKAVGGLGVGAVAAVLAAERVLLALQCVFLIVTGATTPLVSQNWGAGRSAEAVRSTKLAVSLVVLVGIALTVSTWLAAPLVIGLFGLPAPIAAQAVLFLRVVILFNPAFGLSQVMAAALRAVGDAYTPLRVFAAANILNVALLLVLVRGVAGIPGLGVLGAALANGVAYVFSGAALFVPWVLGRYALKYGGGSFRRFDGGWRLMRIGGPVSVQQFVLNFGLFAMMFIVSHFGPDAVAAYGVGVTLISFSYVFGSGFAIASSTLVGQHIGAGDPQAARSSAWRATGLAVVCMSAMGVGVFLLGPAIGRFLGLPPSAVEILKPFLTVLLLVQPLMALEFSLSGALRGAAATRSNMFITLLGLVGGRLLFAFGFYLAGLGPGWIFTALLADYAIKSTLFTLKVRSPDWTRSIVAPATAR